MIAKKTDKGNLENKRTLFILIGLVVVLCLVYAGFELFASETKAPGFVAPDDDFIEVSDEDVIATDQTPPPPAPTQAQQTEVIINLVDNATDVDMDFTFDSEFDENETIEDLPDLEVESIETQDEEETPVHFAAEQPEFPGGMEALNLFLRNEIQYPQMARDNNIQGIVLVEFVVEKDGRVSNAKVVAPLFPDCDKEAVRGIMAMPKWKPAKNNGRPVRCYFKVPVRFSM
ncbi:MAG: energy transducer TonB [Bacteroidales bacterium]|nr:energy transducer TonB [Bacteroidales bacterium]MBO7646877.1 energy transducer TonB [Bacteroidales bacterium]